VPDLCIYGQNMAWVDTLKYLGMYFDTGKTVKVNTSRPTSMPRQIIF